MKSQFNLALTIFSLMASTVGQSALKQIENRCRLTEGATWRADLLRCHCDNSSSDYMYHYHYTPGNHGGKCRLDIEYEEIELSICRETAKFENRLSRYGVNTIQGCLDIEQIQTIKNGFRIKLLTTDPSDVKLVKFARQLDSRSRKDLKPLLPNVSLWWNASGHDDTILLTGVPSSGPVLKAEEVRRLYENDEAITNGSQSIDVRFYYEPDPSLIFEAYETRTTELERLSSRGGFLGKVARAVNTKYINGPLSSHNSSQRVDLLGGKVDSFYLETPAVSSDDVVAFRRTYFLRDIPYRDIISIRPIGASQDEAKIILSPTGMISMMAFYSENVQSLTRQIDAYDRDWNVIGSYQKKVSGQDFGIEAQSREGLRRVLEDFGSAKDDSIAVGVCEHGFQLEREEHDSFAFGPSRNSVFGWYDAQNLGLRGVLGGFGSTNFGGTWDLFSHGSYVSATIRQAKEDARVAPLSLRCYERDLWESSRELLKQESVKVINISNFTPFGQEYCQDYAGHLTTEKDFLFVIGAGNDGLRDPQNRCPQNLSGNSNILIVTGEDVNGNLFDHGLGYADIIAETSAPGSGFRGTSFAAPRVAVLASELLAMTIDESSESLLTPELVKWIIIASSSYNQIDANNVRAGGSLNPNRARQLALAVQERLSEGEVIDKSTITSMIQIFYGTCTGWNKCGKHRNQLRRHL